MFQSYYRCFAVEYATAVLFVDVYRLGMRVRNQYIYGGVRCHGKPPMPSSRIHHVMVMRCRTGVTTVQCLAYSLGYGRRL